jgi:hypothetical protein
VQRVVVFLDYRNVYHGARRAFFAGQASKRLGHVNALALGQLIASRGPAGSQRVLQQVRIYRGMPVAAMDPRGHAAAWRQREAQVADKDTQRALEKVICDEYGYVPYDVVQHCDRPLRYPSDYPRQSAQEKGVDVQLAVDFVSGAFAGRFDVGVIMSTDTDLYPALEAVRKHGIDCAWPFALPPEMSLHDDAVDDYFKAAELVDSATRPVCEVAAWRSADGHSPCLRLPRGGKRPATVAMEREAGKKAPFQPPPEPRMWCHWLDREDYDAVADLTDYSEGDPPLFSR